MIWGFENDKFYIDFISSSRPHGTMREESDSRARELAEQGGKFMLSFTGGVDSQAVLHSFYTQDIPLETVFLYTPGYNDNELEQVKFIDQKYGIKTQIVDIDIDKCKEEIFQLRKELDLVQKVHALHRIFLKLIPEDVHFIQMAHDPFVYVNSKNQSFYYQGYHMPEIARPRGLSGLSRSGKIIFYGDTPEFLLSIINDETYRAALMTARYFDGNLAEVPKKDLKTVDRWDYYIKPIIYGKYWGDELTYFPKFAGIENVDWLYAEPEYKYSIRKHAIMVPYNEMIDFLKSTDSRIKRIYENVPTKDPNE